MYKSMQVNPTMSRLEIDEMEDEDAIITCLVCHSLVTAVLYYRRELFRNHEYLTGIAMEMCVEMNMATPIVCQGLINLNIVSGLSS